MQAKAWLEIQIKNQNPIDIQDYFEIRILNGFTNCEECCNGEVLKFQGMDIDQTILCQMLGESDVVIRWNSRKDGEQTGGEKLIFVPSFDTTRMVFAY